MHGETVGRKINLDWPDQNTVFNADVNDGVLGRESGEIVFWKVVVKVLVQQGKCFVFGGSIITHGGCAVTSGHSNFIDLFCHKTVWDMLKHKVQQSGQAKLEDKSEVCFKFGTLGAPPSVCICFVHLGLQGYCDISSIVKAESL